MKMVRHVDGALGELLEWPADAGQDGEVGNRQYRDLRSCSWDEAESALALEERALRKGSPFTTLAPFLIDEGEYDPDDDDDELALLEAEEPWHCLDVGVAAAVMALSAADCLPGTSCNGQPGHAEVHPLVVFRSVPERISVLLACAKEAKCGLINNENWPGTLILYADEIGPMVAFARHLLARRDSLPKLATPTDNEEDWAP